MDTINKQHDIGYKWLLSSREIFLHLIKSFIDQPWVNEINEDEIKRTDKSFITKDFMEKEADLVYEVNLHGQTVVFYILLELQRKVDFSMPYRLLNYMSGIWQNYLSLLPKEDGLEQKDFRLPAIVPIILYNGTQPWTAARSFRQMLAGEKMFSNHLLDFEYILLDVNRYDDADLLSLSNTIGAVFLLDKNRNPDEFKNILHALFAALQNSTEAEFNIFLRWIRYVFQPRLSPEQQEIFSAELNDLKFKGGKKMVFANLEKSLDGIEEEGRKKANEATALKMLRDNVQAEQIMKYTDLPLEKIYELQRKL